MRLESAGVGATIEQNILPVDKASVYAAQESAGRAEFLDSAEAFSRVAVAPRVDQRINVLPGGLG